MESIAPPAKRIASSLSQKTDAPGMIGFFLTTSFNRTFPTLNGLLLELRRKTWKYLSSNPKLEPFSEGLVLLQKLQESFNRQLTVQAEIEICRLRGAFEDRYRDLPPGRHVRICTEAYKNRDKKVFIDSFKAAGHDMDV